MKELSIEQKAKRYDKALEKSKRLYEQGTITESLAYIFPELRESEDEKIRKDLIIYLRSILSNKKYGDKFIEGWIAWLEKQGQTFTKKDVDDAYLKGVCDAKQELEKQGGKKSVDDLTQQEAMDIAVAKCFEQSEQKPVDKIEPKFKVGDEIRTKNEESLIITRIDRCGYWSEDLLICNFDDADKWELVEQKPAWSEEDEYYYGIVQYILNNERVGKADKENASNWFKSIKDRVQPQPKQEWSEWDEDKFRDVIRIIEQGEPVQSMRDHYTDWLKSLKPQNRWKPSDEQMEVLWKYAEQNNYDGMLLTSLYNDLKKLREE